MARKPNYGTREVQSISIKVPKIDHDTLREKCVNLINEYYKNKKK